MAQEILATSGFYLGQGWPYCLIAQSGTHHHRQHLCPQPPLDLASCRCVLKKESLARTYRRCQVVSAQLGEQIGDLAALCIAIEGEKGSFDR